MAKQRTLLTDVVAKQLPEHIRDNYPTFVAFVEAYYDYLEKQSIDITSARDIDTTLEEFITYFKKELAHNYPIASTIVSDERFLLQHIRDQYLAKGSEASYKLLFRLLFGKDVTLEYPGQSMLRASDGRWRQDYSVFVRVDFGSALEIIGKVVEINTTNRVLRVLVDKNQSFNDVYGSVERFTQITDTIYELFIDRRFYGEIKPGDVVKYKGKFQGTILPTTTSVKITKPGIGFRVGQVFQVKSGDGTPAWMKILGVSSTGGIRSVELIKFGIGYSTDFAVTLLPTSEVKSVTKITNTPATLSYSFKYGAITTVEVDDVGGGYSVPPLVVATGDGQGARLRATITPAGEIDEIIIEDGGTNYTNATIVFTTPNGETGSGGHAIAGFGSQSYYSVLDKVVGFNEVGVINYGEYWDGGRTLSNGSITLVQTTNRGRGYTSAPTFNFWDPLGTGLVVNSADSVSTEKALTLTLTDGGSGYIDPTVTVVGGGGTGMVVLAHINNSNEIDSISVADYGQGYTSLPTFTINDVNGTGAEITAAWDGYKLKEVIQITTAGTGYINPRVYIGSVGSVNWVLNTAYTAGDFLKVVDGGTTRYYIAMTTGTTDSTTPAHTSGTINSGTVALKAVTVSDGGGSGAKAVVTQNIVHGYSDAAYVGEDAREFFIDYKDTVEGDPAVINIGLGALAKYPGYFETNDGFLNDSIFIQDSKYYQAFSYVIKIDEQLSSYSAAVRSMLHPTGMALFGEYSITNTFDVGLALESIVKSLGVTLRDEAVASEEFIQRFSKDLGANSVSMTQPWLLESQDDGIPRAVHVTISKVPNESLAYMNADGTTDLVVRLFIKAIDSNQEWVTPIDDGSIRDISKSLETEFGPYATLGYGMNDYIEKKEFSKELETIETITEDYAQQTDKYVESAITGDYPESGYATFNPYEEGGYFESVYANSRAGEFSV
jgi:hypothetical protein